MCQELGKDTDYCLHTYSECIDSIFILTLSQIPPSETGEVQFMLISCLEKLKVHGCSSEKLYRTWNYWKVYFSVLKFV